MTIHKTLTLIAGVLLLVLGKANAAVIANVQVYGGNPYFNDYDVIFGVGDTSAPDWSVQVAYDHVSGDPFDSTGIASYDITSQFSGNQSWWVLVDDNWGGNSSYLQSFSIDTGTTLYTSTDTPIYIPDGGQGYAFISTTQTETTVPVPTPLALMGLGFLGLGLSRKNPV